MHEGQGDGRRAGACGERELHMNTTLLVVTVINTYAHTGVRMHTVCFCLIDAPPSVSPTCQRNMCKCHSRLSLKMVNGATNQPRACVRVQVKLADFGTADVDPLTVGNPVEACHFSTLENTPIEQLCCGNQARQVQKGGRGMVESRSGEGGRYSCVVFAVICWPFDVRHFRGQS